jgi:hypothetical protein
LDGNHIRISVRRHIICLHSRSRRTYRHGRCWPCGGREGWMRAGTRRARARGPSRCAGSKKGWAGCLYPSEGSPIRFEGPANFRPSFRRAGNPHWAVQQRSTVDRWNLDGCVRLI